MGGEDCGWVEGWVGGGGVGGGRVGRGWVGGGRVDGGGGEVGHAGMCEWRAEVECVSECVSGSVCVVAKKQTRFLRAHKKQTSSSS